MKTMNLDLIKALGIEYSAEFVPFSQSRNKGNKDKSLNWLVTLKRNGVKLTTDYMQGIAHHTDYKKYGLPMFGSVSIGQAKYYKAIIEQSTETGERYKVVSFSNHVSKMNKALPIPPLKGVLYSLITDSDVLQHDSFESWAGDFGFDTDSRSAEKTYQACLQIALKINRMFTGDELDSLREFYQDY